MKLEPKIVLQLPIANKNLLEAFVEECLVRNVSLIAIVGEGCEVIENEIDEIIFADGRDKNRFITTSIHHDEALEDVVSFAEAWYLNEDGPTEVVRL